MGKMQEITISVGVLNLLSPRKNMMNAAKNDLINATSKKGYKFDLHSMVTNEVGKSTSLTDENNEDLSYVKAKYINSETDQSFTIPIRSFLGLETVKTSTDNDEYEAGVTKTSRVSEHLLAATKEGKDTIALPKSFTVVSVTTRRDKPAPDDKHDVYPAYCYKDFNVRVKEINDAAAEAKEVADIRPIYADISFMQGLPGTDIDAGRENVEPTKVIVIALSE
jgi:hypothetical protein